MERTHYKQQPSKMEVDKQRLSYRLDIQVEQLDDGEVEYSAYEVCISQPYSQNKLIEVAMTTLFGNDHENKLINEYNSAVLGLYHDEETKAEKINRYTDFLTERAALKADIERVCADNGIN